MRLYLAVLLSLLSASAIGSRDLAAKQADDPWWTHTVVYQIYPRSFQDSDGDGTGDLKGIESRLGHFVDMGVETIWLSPVYKSPMKDFGYDISDFTDIDPIFGTLADFTDLINAMHDVGMKLVMDFVPNHSSDEHDWFIRSVQREDPYTDYYVWMDPSGVDGEGNPLAPNNWVSVFRGPAWEYNEERGQFYLHQFVAGQPDLNYQNPLVRQEMNDVLRIWLDRGVDGFRFDAVAHIWEDLRFLDEPLSNNPDITDPNDYGYLNHVYTQHQPENKDVLAEMYQTIKAYTAIDGYDRVDMLELYLPIEELLPYLECCSDYPFNFGLLGLNPNPVMAGDVAQIINDWVDGIPGGKGINWVLGNHDKWRLGSRLGVDFIDMMNMITMTLPGVALTYNGEEIGMVNNMNISWEQTVDPSGCNCGIDAYNSEPCSRDPERTPMQWSAEPNAGFSTPQAVPWLPINANYLTLNVEDQTADPGSHLSVYKALINLRYSDPTFKVGSTVTTQQGEVLVIGRAQEDNFYNIYVTLANFGDVEEEVDVMGQFHPLLQSGLTLISSAPGGTGNNPAGTIVSLSSISLLPKEAIIIRLL